ncbi:MAG: hypothetical protein JWM21_2917 [Acidobacteria bacterium]|nr:hypothetical protein [Acidobacteriota bacterium]
MKRCPKCSRTFPDENQKFCTIDGGLLRADQPPTVPFDPNLTVRATSKELFPPPGVDDPGEAPTSMHLGPLNETITSFGSSTFRETSPTGSPTSADLSPPAESAPTSLDLGAFAPAVERAAPVTVHSSANLAPPVSEAQSPAVKKKKSILPWVLVGLVVVLLLGGGAAAAGYFLVLKPMMDAKRGPVVVNENTNKNTSTAATPENTTNPVNANTAVETKKGPEPFVAPADAVQFTNSAANLDGDLAAHYVGFSFYYPRTWTKDPKSGVSGASSFAKIDNQSSTDEGLKERVLFNWYPSKGTYEADTSVFPVSAKKVTDQLSGALPNFEEVSHGETTVNSYKGYEVRFKGAYKDPGKEDIPYWGRVIFLPPGSASDKGGVAIVMLATSLAKEITSAADIGVKGDMALILDSFRFASR